jgi:hypothetical protein
MLPTKERLAQRLHALGFFDLEREARDGQFSDFENQKYAAPKATLIYLLANRCGTSKEADAPIFKLINEVKDGAWDDTAPSALK